MTTPARRIALLVLLILACALPAGGAQAADTRHENVATATVEQDGARVFDFAWDLSKQRGGVVDHYNAAYATATCTGCAATAIAFQVVLASGSSVVTPQNRAVAVNEQCTGCVTVAEARQFVRVTDVPMRLTGEGREELADVRSDLRELEYRDLPPDQLHQAVELQESRVRTVINTQLVPKWDPDGEAEVLDRQLLQAADLG